ncbi:membrane protease subunit, stomatin/prohibitin [Sphingobium sp. C100]|jgi:regulator of protease activity HflC (stomatin/prohibitin superfamily)|uniref:slipin family protein n=1 Tax=Sphingobium sp. C100 TaxID=1207055 RepID=UPI0003D6932A|nr:slipin family protein [Sphingobium sp. C100]ETI63438.1 membrane protease subunit, stomatin/prohibitin [Sphingobium sp. C100]
MYYTFIVSEKQRGLLIRDGRFIRMLEPGRQRIFDPLGRYDFELFDATGIFASPWAELIAKRHPEIAADYFVTVRVEEGKVAVVRMDGRASAIVRPGETVHVWSVLKTVEVEMFDVIAQPRLTREQLVAFEKATTVLPSTLSNIAVVSVGEAEETLVFFDGELIETVGPGRYGYWQIGRKVTSRTVDMRPLPVEVTAQEILTRDKVSLRVTLTAFVKVIDVRRAALSTPDFQAHVYKLVQFAVREAIGGRTLDEVLNDRVSVDRQIVDHVRAAIGDIGVAVPELGIKDVILPGDMRELINRVVEAEKTAEANLIRRREETAATRSLLNTAKLMEGNPVLLRLKELESLERVTEKIGRIDVHASSGEGLNAILDRLVTLRERD